MRSACFASDLHLDGTDPGGVARACRFAAWARAHRSDALFLLGDVFRAWLGPDSLDDAGLALFLHELRACTRQGMRVVLLEGNHDFLLGPHVEAALGVEVAGAGLDVVLAGRRACLVHGDVFCTRDRSYHRLHGVLRSAPVRWLLGHLPRAVLQRAARTLLDAANRSTGSKTREQMGIVDDAVRAALARERDLVICGHVHEARDTQLQGGRLVVMADFERTGSHALWRAGRLELVRHDPRFTVDDGPVVTIDGPAGSGKSSVARAVADRLGYHLLDSGALYRAVTARMLRAGSESAALARSARMQVGTDGSVWLDGERMHAAELRGPAVSARVSAVSADPEVRAALLEVQRGAARCTPGLVAEGRDMGSVVFPEAPFRFYLDARPEVRAARRLQQEPGEGRLPDEVQAALAERDRRDSSRPHAPLTVAAGAERLDTSDLAEAEVVERVTRVVLAGFERRPSGALPDSL